MSEAGEQPLQIEVPKPVADELLGELTARGLATSYAFLPKGDAPSLLDIYRGAKSLAEFITAIYGAINAIKTIRNSTMGRLILPNGKGISLENTPPSMALPLANALISDEQSDLSRQAAHRMLEEFALSGYLCQAAIARDLDDQFERRVTYTSMSGHLSISPQVLKAFRYLTDGYVVWERSTRCWRWRMESDPLGRQVY